MPAFFHWIRSLLRRSLPSEPSQPFNLIRRFSLFSFIIISSVAIGLASLSTRFIINESLERDALLSAQFIQSMAAGEIRHHDLPGMKMGDVLSSTHLGMLNAETAKNRERARSEFLDHLSNLPDLLLASIFSPDRQVIWSTNPALVGRTVHDDPLLESAFSSAGRVSARYDEVEAGRTEQQFSHAPKMFFVENYIPLLDDQGEVLAMVEIYKEPVDLIERLERGQQLIWTASALGGLFVYCGLFWIVWRAAQLLNLQQDQLIANKTYGGLVEMSTAVAHSLRNPLASIRTSAELAQVAPGQPATGNITDIIAQVDRMSRWVSDLLQCLRPLHGEAQAVDLVAAMHRALISLAPQLHQARIQVAFSAEGGAPVISHPLLLDQVINSVLANAIESMPAGGELTLALERTGPAELCLYIDDTGPGLARQQELMSAKSFYTTRQGGLGIGMVMVKQVMERFGGAASLSSRAPRGTRVCLRFCAEARSPDAH
ncbi:HAMP domain-containing histidine kinase [Pseudomonas sp. GD04091]|nr:MULTISPECIES: HAMP domain-containing sensor histidine kinase [unclassified Pseudomonas]MDH0303317.1 HAMP domain-containing histidine kinase [Pseudomonas sp. GD04091]MDH1985341.1 HAMP domain-containing histidine kinase [Pseudomonas sp. GD03689]